jgi:uncharacterized membrane protein YdjX (TVP38/TMEM64 family)
VSADGPAAAGEPTGDGGEAPRGEAAGAPAPVARPWLRLAAVTAALLAAFLAFWVLDLVDRDDVRSLVEPFGPLAAPAYVVVAALLGLALVPGPLLAATSGVLFGAAAGTAVTLASAVLSSVLGVLAARRAIGPPPPRLERLAALAERHGFVAVVVQRLAPAIPDAPATYAFGVLRVRVWQIALGTLVGSAPRSFSYTSIGASLDDPGSPLALAGIGGLVVTAVVGAILARRLVLRHR